MSQAVLISLRPKWCSKIANGEKTIEVRKRQPQLDVLFKVYIYCTKAEERLAFILKDGDENYGEIYHGKTVFGKVENVQYVICGASGRRSSASLSATAFMNWKQKHTAEATTSKARISQRQTMWRDSRVLTSKICTPICTRKKDTAGIFQTLNAMINRANC